MPCLLTGIPSLLLPQKTPEQLNYQTAQKRQSHLKTWRLAEVTWLICTEPPPHQSLEQSGFPYVSPLGVTPRTATAEVAFCPPQAAARINSPLSSMARLAGGPGV